MKNEKALAGMDWSKVIFTVIHKPGANWVVSMKARLICHHLDVSEKVFGSLRHRDYLIIEGEFTKEDIEHACGESGVELQYVQGTKNPSLPFEPHICTYRCTYRKHK